MTKKHLTQPLTNLAPELEVTRLGPKPPKLPLSTGFNARPRTIPKRLQTFVNRRRGK